MMKLGKVSMAALLAFGASYSSGVLAAPICNGCGFNGSSSGSIYIGVYNPNTGDQSVGVNHGQMVDGQNFSDAFFFNINPAGQATVDGSFTPNQNVTLFAAQLVKFAADPATVCTPVNYFVIGGQTFAQAAGTCSNLGAESLVASASISSDNKLSIGYQGLSAGLYAVRLQGIVQQVTGGDNGYSFNLATTRIPEPATLALAGLGLLAAGVASRRRKAA